MELITRQAASNVIASEQVRNSPILSAASFRRPQAYESG